MFTYLTGFVKFRTALENAREQWIRWKVQITYSKDKTGIKTKM